MFLKQKEGVMPKHGKNGREAKKAPLPVKTKGPKPQGLLERIVAAEKEGMGLREQSKKVPPRVVKLYLMHKTPKRH